VRTQPEALRLADGIDPLKRIFLDNLTVAAAAAELRRLSALNVELAVALQRLENAFCTVNQYSNKAERDEGLLALVASRRAVHDYKVHKDSK
jgi:hypothetical protein